MRIGTLSDVRGRKKRTLVSAPSSALATLERVIITGASLESGAFGASINTQNTEIVYAQNRVQAATGKTIVMHEYAVAGQDLDGFMSVSLPKVLSEQAALPGDGKTLVLIGTGGNTVTSNRPLTPAVIADAKAKLESAISQIEAKGWDWCLFDISWRNYSSPLCQYDRSQGSWPWITGVSRAINLNRKRLWGRNWTYGDSASWCDLYSLYRNNVQMLAPGDEVHPSDYLITRNAIIDQAIIPAITGIPATQRFPRDEVYPLGFSLSAAPTITGTSVAVPTISTHQGTAHVALYAAGSTPTAAQVIAGTGTGFVAKVSAARNGTTIDQTVSQTVAGPSGNTAYRVCAAFVADAQLTSSVITADVTTGTPVASTNPVVILLRQDLQSSPRANINQLSSTTGTPTAAGTKIANAVDLTGVASGIAFAVTAPFNQVNNTGNATLSVPGFFQAGELSESWYADTNVAAMSLSGLDPAKSYTLTMAASRNVASTDTTRTGDVAITAGTVTNGATTRTINAANPASGTTAGNITFVVTPTSGGVVSFTLARATGNTAGFAYLGGIHIQPPV